MLRIGRFRDGGDDPPQATLQGRQLPFLYRRPRWCNHGPHTSLTYEGKIMRSHKRASSSTRMNRRTSSATPCDSTCLYTDMRSATSSRSYTRSPLQRTWGRQLDPSARLDHPRGVNVVGNGLRAGTWQLDGAEPDELIMHACYGYSRPGTQPSVVTRASEPPEPDPGSRRLPSEPRRAPNRTVGGKVGTLLP